MSTFYDQMSTKYNKFYSYRFHRNPGCQIIPMQNDKFLQLMTYATLDPLNMISMKDIILMNPSSHEIPGQSRLLSTMAHHTSIHACVCNLTIFIHHI